MLCIDAASSTLHLLVFTFQTVGQIPFGLHQHNSTGSKELSHKPGLKIWLSPLPFSSTDNVIGLLCFHAPNMWLQLDSSTDMESL